jgi:hypothetical protein
MPLTDDQRAMLQLVLQHGQSYEDISALQGIDVEEVRSSARAALTEIGGEDPDGTVGLTDYLLGQADPIGRADVARQLQSDGDTRALAERLAAQLRLIAPGAELPGLAGDGPAPARRKAKPAAKAKPAGEAKPAAGATSDTSTPTAAGPSFGERLSGAFGDRRVQAIAGILGVAALVLVIVLVAGGGGGSSDSSDKNAGGGGGGTTTTQQASNQGPPRAVLEAQDGSKARGIAVIGQIRQVPTLQVTAFNLEPTTGSQSYAIWLRSSKTGIPLGRTKVTKTGRMQVRLQLPTQLLQFIGDRTLGNVDVSLVKDAEFKQAVSSARSKKKLPDFTGKDILSGPIVGAGLSGGSSGSNGSG